MAENAPQHEIARAVIPIEPDTSAMDEFKANFERDAEEMGETFKKALAIDDLRKATDDWLDHLNDRLGETKEKLANALDVREKLDAIEEAIAQVAERAAEINVPTVSDDDQAHTSDMDAAGLRGVLDEIKDVTEDIRDLVSEDT